MEDLRDHVVVVFDGVDHRLDVPAVVIQVGFEGGQVVGLRVADRVGEGAQLETPTLPSGAGWESFESEADTDRAAVMSMPVFWIVSGYAPSVSSSVLAI